MAKPWIHACSSAKRYGGKPEDYVAIHELMDSSKAVMASNLHRTLTHNSWFISQILPKIFGNTFTNSNGDTISTRDIGEQHVLEDFRNKFIPTPQDYLENMELKDWMNNAIGGSAPASYKKIQEKEPTGPIEFSLDSMTKKPKELID